MNSNKTLEEIEGIYRQPLLKLLFEAAAIHRLNHDLEDFQKCAILSIKSGGCSEDCSYCAQSVKYKTELSAHKVLEVDEVVKTAYSAKENGATRFCMGAAWSGIRENRDFEKILEMISSISQTDMEVCCSLGMVSKAQALRLKEAGLTSYNHNLDTSENFYNNIITTRTYKDRLTSLKNLSEAGIKICSGGILGLGESEEDRISMIHSFGTLPSLPDSIPVNMLVPIKGTPMADFPGITVWEIARTIATLRIAYPEVTIRLAAGRSALTAAEQTICFLAGANSVFTGEKLLTTPNAGPDEDQALFYILGIENQLLSGLKN